MAKNIDYGRWKKIITRVQVIILITIFVAEAIGNVQLFLTGTQGYGPDTIVQKLIRYLLITTLTNITIFIIGQIIVKCNPNNMKLQKYTLILTTVVMLGNVAYSHYQFTVTFATFSIAVALTVLYEDTNLCLVTTIVSGVILGFCCFMRGIDSEYNQDIGPETLIAVALLITFYLITKMSIRHMQETRKLLNEAILKEEENKYSKLLEKKNKDLHQLSTEVIESFAKAVDFNDPYTAGHSRRVGKYSKMIAERLGLSEEDCENIYYVGLLHDVGKLGIDNSILNKPGKLSEEEYAEIKKHPTMGYEILKGISIHAEYGLGAKLHHECLDGSGYPDHITEIPLIGRIISIADAYDAMTSKRSYRSALPQEKVREQLLKHSGTQFDSELVKIMVQLIDEDVNYELRQDDSFTPNLN